ncbi:MAG: hypothetical protein PHH82_01805 [Candidatus ainarchaeum sp.]|nr:hypothetical protein [Candidatus ainarchaeum sp.]
MDKIKICWIKPQDIQLKIVPSKDSKLFELIGSDGKVLSYDGQINYPFTSILSAIRQLQSALGNIKLESKLLNLSAVPRNLFISSSWKNKYLGPVYKKIEYGKSNIELRNIGVPIESIKSFDELVDSVDLFVCTTPFESRITEVGKVGKYLKSKYGEKIVLLASGTGVEGYEDYLLDLGFDFVFVGTVTDRGEDVLKGIVTKDYASLSEMPGVNYNFKDKKVRNLGPRNYQQPDGIRKRNIYFWKKEVAKYFNFCDIDVELIGREELIDKKESLLDYCCSMQDLPIDTIINLLGKQVRFAADEFFISFGCQRNCDFCHAGGKGYFEKSVDNCKKLLDYYCGLGATALIPTDDQVLFGASNDESFAKKIVEILDYAKALGFKFFYGNGIEIYSLAIIIQKSKHNNIYKKLISLFLDTLEYVYLPYENIWGLSCTPEKSKIAKCSLGLKGYKSVLSYLDCYARKHNKKLEVGTNIILSLVPKKTEITLYYKKMDKISEKYKNLTMRYNGFFLIPSKCASHYSELSSKNKIYDEPEIKIVSLPTIYKKNISELEEQYYNNLNALRSSKTKRKMENGFYKLESES